MLRTIAKLLLASCLLLLATSAAHAQRGRDRIECRSQNYGVTVCAVYWNDAQLIQQTSDSACVRGRTWGISNRGLWVDRGCAGVFAEAGRRGGGWRPEPGWDQSFSLTCGSDNYQYNFCSIDVGRGGRVYIERQISNTPCIEGRSWGWNRAGVWVSQGCEARFTVDRRWR